MSAPATDALASAPTDAPASTPSSTDINAQPAPSTDNTVNAPTNSADANTQTAEDKYNLITRNLQETLGGDLIRGILAEGRAPRCYWGTAPTGRPHIGYFVPLAKIADLLTAGVEVKVLIADIHAFLDNMKAPLELVQHRAKYYRLILSTVFATLGIPTSKLTFVLGSSYQLTPAYSMDTYRLAASVTEHDAKKAGAEVVKQVESAFLSGLLYPGMQALDEEYLKVDMQFGGVDQRKIFTFAEATLPKLGYAKRAHLMNSMVPGLAGAKMSASDPDSKIDFLEAPEKVKSKIKKAFCEEGNVENNGVLSFVGAVLIPISQLRQSQLAGRPISSIEDPDQRPFVSEDAPPGTAFTIERESKFGGNMHFASFEDLKEQFAKRELHPKDLKGAVAASINRLLGPIRKAFEESEEWREVEALAYPDPKKVGKKVKKEKVYHPPPPGKGKNANAQPFGQSTANPAEGASTQPSEESKISGETPAQAPEVAAQRELERSDAAEASAPVQGA